MSTLVMKFGGSCIDTTHALTQTLNIVLYEHEHWDRLLLVASALEGVTDSLIEAAHLAQLSNRRGYRRIVATIRTRHLALAEYLPLGPTERSTLLADIDRLLFDMLDIFQSLGDPPSDTVNPDILDAILGVGERLAARIIAAMLRQNNVRGVAIDATDLIVTDGVYGNANPDMPLTRERISRNLLPMLDRKIIPVTTGFIGATPTGKPTTLGRGGSDYTASILAVCVNADEVWIWTDSDGLMTANPREIEAARTIPEMSYDEVSELAYFGARILHTRMIYPLRERGIPFRIKNVFKPNDAGSLIHEMPVDTTPAVKAVTSVHGVGLVAKYTGPPSAISRLVDEALLASSGSYADVVITSRSSSHGFLCFAIPTNPRLDAWKTTQKALESSLQRTVEISTWEIYPVSVVTAIGTQLDAGITARILQALDDIPVVALALGPSGCSLSIMVGLETGEQALNRIHQLIVNNV